MIMSATLYIYGRYSEIVVMIVFTVIEVSIRYCDSYIFHYCTALPTTHKIGVITRRVEE